MRQNGHLQLAEVASGFSFLEGPRWRDGALYLSDFHTGQVLRYDGRGVATVCSVTGQPSGLGFDSAGNLLVVSMMERRILRWDGNTLAAHADLSGYFSGPANDMTVARSGRAYVSNLGLVDAGRMLIEPTCLVSVDTAGVPTVAAEGLFFPNGMALTPDEGTLLVAETYAARIRAYDVAADGSLSSARTWAQFGEPAESLDLIAGSQTLPVLPDGLALDDEGCLWVGDAKGRGIQRVAEGGAVRDYIGTGDLTCYAAALGGPDGRTLYLCCAPEINNHDLSAMRAAKLLAVRVAVPAAR